MLQKLTDNVLNQHYDIYNSKKYKSLKGKIIYFKGQNIIKNTQFVIEQLNKELKECFKDRNGLHISINKEYE